MIKECAERRRATLMQLLLQLLLAVVVVALLERRLEKKRQTAEFGGVPEIFVWKGPRGVSSGSTEC